MGRKKKRLGRNRGIERKREREREKEREKESMEFSISEPFDCYLGAIQCNYWLELLRQLIVGRQARQCGAQQTLAELRFQVELWASAGHPHVFTVTHIPYTHVQTLHTHTQTLLDTHTHTHTHTHVQMPT